MSDHTATKKPPRPVTQSHEEKVDVNNDLAAFLDRYPIGQESKAVWGNGQIQLRVRAYLSEEFPPSRYISSVRCLLFRETMVLVMQHRDSVHVLPGGRREADEDFETTLRRELLEETGWIPRNLLPIGFLHFHHISPRPTNYLYPYPDFIHAIYRAEADVFQPEGRLADDHEQVVGFMPVEDAVRIPGDLAGRWYLNHCLRDG